MTHHHSYHDMHCGKPTVVVFKYARGREVLTNIARDMTCRQQSKTVIYTFVF